MAQAAIPILAGTGLQIIGASQGWDPRITALASIAAGGIGAGMAGGAFAGGTAAQAATGAAATNAFNPATTGVLAGSTAGQTALAARTAQAAAFPSAGLPDHHQPNLSHFLLKQDFDGPHRAPLLFYPARR